MQRHVFARNAAVKVAPAELRGEEYVAAMERSDAKRSAVMRGNPT